MDVQAKILDIGMNLNRIGNWAADNYQGKQKRIHLFLDQTVEYLDSINRLIKSKRFRKTFDTFQKEFNTLQKEGKKGPEDEQAWAEKMMTWGNILTHRSQLLK